MNEDRKYFVPLRDVTFCDGQKLVSVEENIENSIISFLQENVARRNPHVYTLEQLTFAFSVLTFFSAPESAYASLQELDEQAAK